MIESSTDGPGFGWFFNHLPTVLWHRRLWVFGIFGVCVLAATITAFALPTSYRSTATLLIESQQLPTEVAEAPGIGAIEQRIAKIRERVLSRGDLIALIEQYDLYPVERRKKPLSKILDRMKKATTVGALEGDIGQPAGGGLQSNVIALNMSFDYPDPVKAQEVLQSFVSSFLKMDSDVVEDQASLTVRFLDDQAQKLQAQIRQIESQITQLKAQNGSALVQSGVPAMLDTGSYSAQIIDLQNQNRQLVLQSRRPAARDQQLTQAEAALAAAQAMYSDRHPDVIAARERVKALRQAPPTSDGGESAAIQEQIRSNNDAIATLRAQRDAAVTRASALSAGQSRAPAILEQAAQLEDRANALREQYKDVSTNLLKAQNSARMAGEQRAERLSLIEPASLPDHPNWPNRPLLIGAGIFAGIIFGLLASLIIEIIKRPLRSPIQIEGMGFPVVGIVPVIDPPARARRTLFRRREAKFA
jgi:uncharacterized protein involved in exopolysaccharide biosynthesis